MKEVKKWQDVKRSDEGYANWPVLMQREIDELREVIAAEETRKPATPTEREALIVKLRFSRLQGHTMGYLDSLIAEATDMLEADVQAKAIPKVTVELPDGDTRHAKARFTQWRDGELLVSISIDDAQQVAVPQDQTEAEKTWRRHLDQANRESWPVVTFDRLQMNKIVGLLDKCRAAPQPPQQGYTRAEIGQARDARMVAERVPMTDAEIVKRRGPIHYTPEAERMMILTTYTAGIRAAEAHHGIVAKS